MPWFYLEYIQFVFSQIEKSSLSTETAKEDL